MANSMERGPPRKENRWDLPASNLCHGRAAFIDERHRSQPAHVASAEVLEPKSCSCHQATHVAIEVTSTRQAFPHRREPPLPFLHAGIRREPVFGEQETTVGF